MAKTVLVSTHIQNQNRTHNADIEIIGYEENGRYVIVAVSGRWFIIESVVVMNKLIQEMVTVRDIVWPLASQDNLKKYEILAKESDPSPVIETRLDKEELTYKGTKWQFDDD